MREAILNAENKPSYSFQLLQTELAADPANIDAIILWEKLYRLHPQLIVAPTDAEREKLLYYWENYGKHATAHMQHPLTADFPLGTDKKILLPVTDGISTYLAGLYAYIRITGEIPSSDLLTVIGENERWECKLFLATLACDMGQWEEVISYVPYIKNYPYGRVVAAKAYLGLRDFVGIEEMLGLFNPNATTDAQHLGNLILAYAFNGPKPDKAPHLFSLVPRHLRVDMSLDDPYPIATLRPRHTEDFSTADELITELENYIGLTEVKQQIVRLRKEAEVRLKREKMGLKNSERTLHLVFSGPPGTGKTTIARWFGKLYRSLGILSSGHMVEVSRKDLVGEHLGSTAPKTQAVIDKAKGGVLFIDEAYTLNQTGLSGGDAFGKEAIDTLMISMENDRADLMVIMAGYRNEMDRLMTVNEGLRSRIAAFIDFAPYTPQELLAIAERILLNNDYKFDQTAQKTLLSWLEQQERQGLLHKLPNARMIRTICDNAFGELSDRVYMTDSNDSQALTTITASDIVAATQRFMKTERHN